MLNSTSRAVRVQLVEQGPCCQIAEDILVAVTNCLLVGCAECCAGSIRVVYVSVTWLGCFNTRCFHPHPHSLLLFHQCIFKTYLYVPVNGGFNIHLTKSLWKCLHTGICRVRKEFFSQGHTCFPYKPTGCHYSHPHLGWQCTYAVSTLMNPDKTAQHS